jgi:hypothetical protein
MSKTNCSLATALFLVAVWSISGAALSQTTAQSQACAAGNVPCQCSFSCCGEERCNGAICNQCVLDCVQRKKPTDARSADLQSRCQGQTTQKFRRL